MQLWLNNEKWSRLYPQIFVFNSEFRKTTKFDNNSNITNIKKDMSLYISGKLLFTVSNAFLKSTKAIYRGLSCHFLELFVVKDHVDGALIFQNVR